MQEDHVEPGSRGHGNNHDKRRFLRKGTKLLWDWFHQHQDWLYLTQEGKAELACETEFTGKQLPNWFSNAHRGQEQTYQSSKPAQVFDADFPMPRAGSGLLVPITPME